MNDSGLTIAEAATRLGVHERRLRRLLTRPEYAARTVTETRRTRTGTRTATALPVDLITDLSAFFERQSAPEPPVEETVSERGQEPGATLTVTALAAYTDRLLQERERVIAAKDAEIETLKTALESERENSRRLSDALTRTQALLAIAPPSAQEKQRPWWAWWRRREAG